ncbi:MAG: phage terminase large subunit family protein, partial [Pseudomonadota bacterium]
RSEANTSATSSEMFASMAPPPDLSLSDWADEHFYLSVESSSEPGRWVTLPFQRGWMDAISSDVPKVTIMKSARVGYTKTFTAAIGYHVHQDPCSMLVLQPTDDDAKGFSTEELQPMFRDVPALQRKLSGRDADGRKERQTMLKLQTTSGMITIAGAKSPKNFRRITVRKVFRDEIDAYVADAKEGDPIALSKKRTQTAPKPQEINGSTPTLKGFSLIEREYENSNKQIFEVPCPHCGEFQQLKWSGVKWPEGKPREAYYRCAHNGCVIEESDKAGMIAKGRWRALRPEVTDHAGFHISALYSPWAGARWGVLAQEFVEAKRGGPVLLQPFINTVLGETWDPGSESVTIEKLMARRVDYAETELPGDAVLVTAGVDIQDDRFEIEFVGWEPNHTSWSLHYARHFGDPTSPQFWDALDEELGRQFVKSSGHIFKVEAACVDSGGHFTDSVYRFCTPRLRKRIYAIKGATTWEAPIWPTQRAKNAKKGAIVFVVGVNAAKMRNFLQLQTAEGHGGYCHFPTRYGEDYFQQLTAEKLLKHHHKGRETREFVKAAHDRNEVQDCRAYATVARESVSFDLAKRLNSMAPRHEQPAPPPAPKEQAGGFIPVVDDWLRR